MATALEHLARLVAFDTQNPPRAIVAGEGIFAYLRAALTPLGFRCEVTDLGAGCVYLFATRGAPSLLWNFHVDTVPVGEGWSGPPLTLRTDGDRAIGRGACDVKGGAACMLAALERATGPAALLFSSDEEAGDDRCVKHFLATPRSFRGAVIGEPTCGRAVLGHRGMATASGTFTGVAGHASAARALGDSALHEAVRWGSRALAAATDEETRTIAGLAGIRFNLGVIEGGTKTNMIADRARVRFGVRSRPGEDPLAVVAALEALAPDPSRVVWERGFVGLPLPATGGAPATALAESLELPIGDPVDFWSEASLFAAAGISSLVYGPGDIAQAHAPDEWVTLAALDEATATYRRILGS